MEWKNSKMSYCNTYWVHLHLLLDFISLHYRYPDDFLRKTYHTTHCICSFMHHSINKKEELYHPNVSVLYFFSNCVTFIFYNFIFSFKTMDTHVTSEKKSKSYQSLNKFRDNCTWLIQKVLDNGANSLWSNMMGDSGISTFVALNVTSKGGKYTGCD